MSRIDRSTPVHVCNLVRGSAFTMALVVGLAGCGGGSKKATTPGGGTQTTPVKPADGAIDDLGGAYDETAGGFDAPAGGGAPQDIDPVEPEPPAPTGGETPTTQPEAPKAEPIKPPGNELPEDRKRQLVSQHLQRAGQAVRGRDADRAIEEAKKALNYDETNVEAMIVLAHAYYLKDFDDKALNILDLAQKRPEGQRHAVGWMLSGLIHDRNNREDKALEGYEKAIAAKPDYLNALNNAGAIYLKRKRYRDAIHAFEQVISIQPNNPRGRTHLGAAYRGRSAELQSEDPGQREQLLRRAESELKTAMTQDPTYAPAYFNLGILYLDADPFPGLETLLRFQSAQRYLSEYKRVAGSRTLAVVDDYLAAAQKGYDREKRALEKKRQREEKERNKPKGDAAKEGGGQ